MGKGRLYRTEGIVLRRRDQGEADRVLTLCTPTGKLDVIAKGVHKSRSRKAGHIELFSRSSFVIAQVQNSWDIISQAETLEPHALLRGDLIRGAYARYAIELVDRFFTEGEGGRAAFDLLDKTLTWLCRDDDLDLIARSFEQTLLELAGFRPELFYCVGGHNSRVSLRPNRTQQDRRPYGLDLERGGVLCPDCYTRAVDPRTTAALSNDTLHFLQDCQSTPYENLRGKLVPSSLHQTAEQVIRRYITYHLDDTINSLAFLHRLRYETATGVNPVSHDIRRGSQPQSS
jgi:DNA repair protein RecO (recombination protein O)